MVMVMMMLVIVMVMLVLMIMVMVMMMLMLIVHAFKHLLQHVLQFVRTFDRLKHILTVQLLQRCGNDRSFIIVFSHNVHCRIQLLTLYLISPAQNDRAGIFNLIHKKLAEILGIHLCLGCIHHSNCTVHLNIQILRHIFHCAQYVRELADTGGLDQNTLRRIFLDHILQRRTEVSDQRTADTSGIHLLDLDPCVLQKTAVNANLPELILDQHSLRPVQRLLQKLLYQSGLSRSQETRYHINFCHCISSSLSCMLTAHYVSRTPGCRHTHSFCRSPALFACAKVVANDSHLLFSTI